MEEGQLVFNLRPETGDRRPETGDRRPETEDRSLLLTLV